MVDSRIHLLGRNAAPAVSVVVTEFPADREAMFHSVYGDVVRRIGIGDVEPGAALFGRVSRSIQSDFSKCKSERDGNVRNRIYARTAPTTVDDDGHGLRKRGGVGYGGGVTSIAVESGAKAVRTPQHTGARQSRTRHRSMAVASRGAAVPVRRDAGTGASAHGGYLSRLHAIVFALSAIRRLSIRTGDQGLRGGYNQLPQEGMPGRWRFGTKNCEERGV